MSGNVQSASHLISTINLRDEYDLYSTFTDEATEAQGGRGAPSDSAFK